MRASLKAAILLVVCLPVAAAPSAELAWKKLDDGLMLAEVPGPGRERADERGMTILKLDPAAWSLRLLTVSEQGGVPLTARQWSRRHDLAVVVNAGMYADDGTTSVGYMRNFGHTVNGHVSRSYMAVLAFNPLQSGLPAVQIIDRQYQDFEELRGKYGTLIQGIRMVSLKGENTWRPRAEAWSMVVAALDAQGNVLFLFARAPRAPHDFVEEMLALPLGVKNVIYLEGGPEATLYLHVGGVDLERIGFNVGVGGESSGGLAWPLPNVIGAVKRAARKGDRLVGGH